MSLESLALECWLGRPDASGIAAWCAELEPSDPASELRRLGSKDRIESFCDVARQRCGYPPRTARGSRAAVVVLRDLCKAALDKRLRLFDLADAIARIESLYVLDNVDPDVPAPPYLDDLRDVLDWCDASWTLDGDPARYTELRRIHDALEVAAVTAP